MRTRKNHSKKKSFWAIFFALWLVFILLSQVPFFAENLVDTKDMEDTYEYQLSFPQNGKQDHYYVERYNTNDEGRIHVQYTTESNSLKVECTNIKILKIYCREMYEKKSQNVFKMDPTLDSSYYKTYFIDRDHFQVQVNTEQMITKLEFIDAPIPYNVTVNDQEWWIAGINYTYNNDSIVLTKVPAGHSYVDIYFKSNDLNSPVAQFTTSKTVLGQDESIIFDASTSYDPDGEIVSYVWDFGDGSYKTGVNIAHTYLKEGKYKVILTVRDDYYLVDRAYQELVVVRRAMSISKSVNKVIATPGSILTYTITPDLNTTWVEGVKEIEITDTLPEHLEYNDATPIPLITNNTLTWKLGTAFGNIDLNQITLQATIKKDVENNTRISNNARISYTGTNDQQFPQEISNIVFTEVNNGSILAPKMIVPVPNVELQEDDPPHDLYLNPYEYDFHDSDTDLKWHITDENESLYILSGEFSENDILTIIPFPNAFGNDLVTLWLVDSEGYTTNQPLWINITPVNDNPIFSDAPDLIIHYDSLYTFNYEPYIFDIDTTIDRLQLFISENVKEINGGRNNLGRASGSEIGNYIEINGLDVTYEFPESYLNKKVIVALTIFDGEGRDEENIQINITDDYTPQLIKKIPNVRLFEGETKQNVFDLDDYFDDPDKDSLFYSYGETHVTVLIHEDHKVDISSASDWYGLDTITFRARDPIGALAEDTIIVTVIPINDPPVIEGVPETFFVHYGVDYSFDLTPYVSDKDNATEDLFLILNDQNTRIDPLNLLRIVMNYPKAMLDMEIPLKIIVSDGINTDIQNVTIKVTENWPPEIKKELPDVSFDEDEILINAFNLNEYFSDKDSSALYYSYGQKFVNITINLDSSVDFSAFKDWNGVEIVTFRATDNTQAFIESVIEVTVVPVNDPPVIKSLPAQNGVVKQLLKFDLTEFIDDIDNDFSKLTITVDSDLLDIVINGKELIIYSDKPVVEDVTIKVTDGHTEASGTLHVEIREVKSSPSAAVEFLTSMLWVLILVIIVIISITSFAFWRRYAGDYEIEEIFWIYNDGVLITHISAQQVKSQTDEALISAMLTAVSNFTQDAFYDETTDIKELGIKEIQMHQKNILVDKGNYSFLATVFSGKSGRRLYSKSRKTLQGMEGKYENILKSWKSVMGEVKGSDEIIKSNLLPIQRGRTLNKSQIKK